MSAGSSSSLKSSPGSEDKCQVSFDEKCSVDPLETRQPTPEAKLVHKAHLEDANGKESETVGFISGSAEPSSAAQTCNPCSSPGSCKTFVFSVITCGLYRVCQHSILGPCLAPSDSSPEEPEPERVSLRAVNPGDNKGEDDTGWSDFCINGVRVSSPKEYLDHDTKYLSNVPQPGVQTQPKYLWPHESMSFDDWEDGEENVDSLITKKLLELYSEYQIEELARCTSDSVFLRKSKTITQLINSLAEEHKMDEQEAECRLVRGIIRISTRKSSKKRPPLSRVERTFSDSGHETMNGSGSFSLGNNNDYSIQISNLTSSDKFAREMWRNNGGHTSGPLTMCPPSQTDSSGVPLTHSSLKT